MNHLPSVRSFATVLLIGGLIASSAALSGCGIGDPTQADAVTTPADPASLVHAAAARRASVCFDWSHSVDVASRRDARDALARFVTAWPIQPVRAPDGSSPGVPGLDLRIRKVMGGATPTGSTGAEVVHVIIPSIPEVQPTPAPDAPDFDRADLAARTQRQAAGTASSAAAKAATQGVERIRTADYTASSSEIVGCVEAAARADTAAPVVVISDLAQADDDGRGLEFSGRPPLRGRRILLVEACGTHGICGEHTPAWTQALTAAGAHVEVTAPEAIDTALPTFLGVPG